MPPSRSSAASHTDPPEPPPVTGNWPTKVVVVAPGSIAGAVVGGAVVGDVVAGAVVGGAVVGGVVVVGGGSTTVIVNVAGALVPWSPSVAVAVTVYAPAAR